LIEIPGHVLILLNGAEIIIPDLRAGFSYLIAAIIAKGKTIIKRVEKLDRGYEEIDKRLKELGASIERRHINNT